MNPFSTGLLAIQFAMPTLILSKLNVYVADFSFCCFVLLRRHFLVCVSAALLRFFWLERNRGAKWFEGY